MKKTFALFTLLTINSGLVQATPIVDQSSSWGAYYQPAEVWAKNFPIPSQTFTVGIDGYLDSIWIKGSPYNSAYGDFSYTMNLWRGEVLLGSAMGSGQTDYTRFVPTQSSFADQNIFVSAGEILKFTVQSDSRYMLMAGAKYFDAYAGGAASTENTFANGGAVFYDYIFQTMVNPAEINDVLPVPEPPLLSLLGIGLIGFGLTRRRKQIESPRLQ